MGYERRINEEVQVEFKGTVSLFNQQGSKTLNHTMRNQVNFHALELPGSDIDGLSLIE